MGRLYSDGGGPRAPLAFNLIVAAMWSSTIREWDSLGLGYYIEFATGSTRCVSTVSHFLWADNCYLLARSREELTRMLYGLTTRLHEFDMRWKASSLLYMVFGAEIARDGDGGIPHSADLLLSLGTDASDLYRFRRVPEMEVLGAQISCDYQVNGHVDIEFRIGLARRAFWGQAAFFRSTAMPSRIGMPGTNREYIVLFSRRLKVAWWIGIAQRPCTSLKATAWQ